MRFQKLVQCECSLKMPRDMYLFHQYKSSFDRRHFFGQIYSKLWIARYEIFKRLSRNNGYRNQLLRNSEISLEMYFLMDDIVRLNQYRTAESRNINKVTHDSADDVSCASERGFDGYSKPVFKTKKG